MLRTSTRSCFARRSQQPTNSLAQLLYRLRTLLAVCPRRRGYRAPTSCQAPGLAHRPPYWLPCSQIAAPSTSAASPFSCLCLTKGLRPVRCVVLAEGPKPSALAWKAWTYLQKVNISCASISCISRLGSALDLRERSTAVPCCERAAPRCCAPPRLRHARRRGEEPRQWRRRAGYAA